MDLDRPGLLNIICLIGREEIDRVYAFIGDRQWPSIGLQCPCVEAVLCYCNTAACVGGTEHNRGAALVTAGQAAGLDSAAYDGCCHRWCCICRVDRHCRC